MHPCSCHHCCRPSLTSLKWNKQKNWKLGNILDLWDESRWNWRKLISINNHFNSGCNKCNNTYSLLYQKKIKGVRICRCNEKKKRTKERRIQRSDSRGEEFKGEQGHMVGGEMDISKLTQRCGKVWFSLSNLHAKKFVYKCGWSKSSSVLWWSSVGSLVWIWIYGLRLDFRIWK